MMMIPRVSGHRAAHYSPGCNMQALLLNESPLFFFYIDSQYAAYPVNKIMKQPLSSSTTKHY